MPQEYNVNDVPNNINGVSMEKVLADIFKKCFDEEFEQEFGVTYEDHVKADTIKLYEHLIEISDEDLTPELKKLQDAAKKLMDDERL